MLSWVLWLPGLAGLYVVAYLLSTEVWRGQMGETRYCIRLFRSTWHLRIFEPLVAAEQRLRPASPEFYGQVRNGASLPPMEEIE